MIGEINIAIILNYYNVSLMRTTNTFTKLITIFPFHLYVCVRVKRVCEFVCVVLIAIIFRLRLLLVWIYNAYHLATVGTSASVDDIRLVKP